MKEKLIAFLKRETVLCAAFLLAAVSMFFVPPDGRYASYVDFRTLAILFCLMGVMAGLQKTGVFQRVAQILLSKVKNARQLALILVLLCFFSSMLATNDVALMTFVPFAFVALDMVGPQAKKRLLVPIVVLQTVAANLGSMLTPVGNPQNLYLYGKAGLSLTAFLRLTLPYTLVSLLAVVVWTLFAHPGRQETVELSISEREALAGQALPLAAYGVLFAFNLLSVARAVPYGLALGVTAAGFLLLDRSVFRRVDYSLLLTFVGFFIFIGNLGRLPAFSHLLQRIVSGNEILADRKSVV